MCVDFLLKIGAEKDVKDNDGATALISASAKGHFECVGFLLKAGAGKDAKANNGITAFFPRSCCQPECPKQ